MTIFGWWQRLTSITRFLGRCSGQMRSNYHRSGSRGSTCEVLLNPKMMGKFIGKSVDAGIFAVGLGSSWRLIQVPSIRLRFRESGGHQEELAGRCRAADPRRESPGKQSILTKQRFSQSLCLSYMFILKYVCCR